jgi:hypothetical protein
MSVLSAVRSAAIRLSQTQPASLFSSTQTFDKEMADLVTESAISIAEAHDWRALTKLGTLVGDDASIAFNLPADYARMPVKARLHSTQFVNMDFTPARDLDEWLYLNDYQTMGTPGNWIVLTGKMQIFPPMPTGESARFYYITNYVADGKAAFSTDTDAFLLPERLLTLDLIWRWRSMKRTEYAEDMQNFEIALSKAINSDRGSQIITVGTQRYPVGINTAYPGVLGA